MHWFWYTKGDGSQEISKVPKPLDRNKIIVIILALLNTLPQAPPGTYSVTLNNFFTSTKLFVYLLAEGFGACDTIRTNAGIH